MAPRKEKLDKESITKRPDKPVKPREPRQARPASTPEGRELQLVDLAVTLAEKQLRDGTASPSIINHYLKLATKREVLERDILEKQSALIQAKAESIVKEKENEQLAKAAMEAMKSYTSSSGK